MPKNEEGEFELVLGNRQLLSVFFIVVVLLGVFFTMGYIVGRNSLPATDTASVRPSDSTPPASTAPPPVRSEPEPAAAPKSEPPESLASKEPTKVESEKPVVKSQRRAEPPPKAAPERVAPLAAQPSGTYLQLAATSKREAEILVDVLRDKKFKAISSEVPERAGLFRVLVGPLNENAVNKMRADLQGAGFPGNSAIKRTF